MNGRTITLSAVIGGMWLSLASAPPAQAQGGPQPEHLVTTEDGLTTHATGTFEVRLTPQPADAEGGAPGRMTIDKQFHGDLEATSKGEMLMAGTAVKGSAGYVALERVSGTLKGRKGAFVLQHSGTMNRGAAHLVISVVPDSGTDKLMGLSGAMTITITDGKHFYDFEYALPDSP